MAEYHLEPFTAANAPRWEEFNTNSDESSFFHSLKWKEIIENSLDFRTQYFLLFKNSGVSGIFPFIEQKNRVFNGFIPLTGTGHRNAIIRNNNDTSGIQFLIREFREHTGQQKKIAYFCFSTLHQEHIDKPENFPFFPYEEKYGNMILNLQEFPPERIWESFSSQKRRIKFRNFEKRGYGITEICSEDGIKLFYEYYKENTEFIGGTPYPLSHFGYLVNNLLPDEMRITLLSKGPTVAGGLLVFPYKPRKTVYFRYLSMNRNVQNLSPSYYLYWDAINWAWNNKYEKISFGSQFYDENHPRFLLKKEFGANFQPVYSKIISLSCMFTLVHKGKDWINRMVKKRS